MSLLSPLLEIVFLCKQLGERGPALPIGKTMLCKSKKLFVEKEIDIAINPKVNFDAKSKKKCPSSAGDGKPLANYHLLSPY